MKPSTRTALLALGAALMIFGAASNALVLLPDLTGDLIEIGVRPSVLGGTVLGLRFAAMAHFGFAAIVTIAAFQSMRGIAPARAPLAVIAIINIAFGAMAFSLSHNPHHLGPVLMGILVGLAVAIPSGR